ncbi:hypothetical protein LRZ95_00480 [Candidatus Gracilibacteria bacterium]|nr:hypothetical protein [Candidatus Gracilibacteria bacterium]
MDKILREKIILPSWELIKNDTKVKKFYLFPGIISIIFLSVLLVYQTIYTYVELFGQKEQALEIILEFFHSNYVVEILIGSIIFLIIYFLLIPIFEGGLIKYIESKDLKKEFTTSEAFGQGVYNFFPLFEYNNLFSEFKIISILNGYLFTIRFIGVEYIKHISYIFIILLILGIILNILFVYSKYIIVLNKKNVFESIGISSKITILNIKRTTKLYFLILFLNMRVVFNFIIFLSFPIIIVIAISLITTKIFLIMAISIIILLFIVLILILGYLSAVLEVFKTAVWYYAYHEGKKLLEDELSK